LACVKILNQKHAARFLFVVAVGPWYFGIFTEAQTPAFPTRDYLKILPSGHIQIIQIDLENKIIEGHI
jgi:hypothetical protein